MREDQLYAAGEATVRSVAFGAGYEQDVTIVVLPHSCDGWKIGYREHVQQLIADLQGLLSVVPASPRAEATREGGDG